MDTSKVLTVVYWAYNAVVFLIYGADKLAAKLAWRRVRERTLILLAFLMGGVGAFFGMLVFRHKTRHASFRWLVPIAALLNIVIIFYVTENYS